VKCAEKVATEGGCWWGNRQASGLLEELGADDMIILKRTLKKLAGRLWTASSG
jgi:hypothetical protein